VVHTNGRRTAQLSRPVVSVGVLSIVWWCLLSLDLKGKKSLLNFPCQQKINKNKRAVLPAQRRSQLGVVRVDNDVYVGLPRLSLRLLLCWWVGVEAPACGMCGAKGLKSVRESKECCCS
jgi:hypothetical protein